jgi:hypothetical protein
LPFTAPYGKVSPCETGDDTTRRNVIDGRLVPCRIYSSTLVLERAKCVDLVNKSSEGGMTFFVGMDASSKLADHTV